MDIQTLKEIILENDYIPKVLESLGCHNIKDKYDYYTCGNPNGDNPNAITVYKNDNLTTINYTRIINPSGNTSDLITLVEFFKELSFPQAIKFICDILDINYYHNPNDNIPKSLLLTKMLIDMTDTKEQDFDEKPLKPISEKILTYFKPYVNSMFEEDGVSYETQREFEIGYDELTNRITIPIRDDIGNLVGVKGRYFYREVPSEEQKFIYLERCAKSQILYGLYKTINFIKQKKRVFVVEAEKGVQQLYDKGYCESVSTGGSKISRSQINKLTRLGVPIIFVFDKDVTREELESIASMFIDGVEVFAIIDTINILGEKESPTDDIKKFERLLSECVYKLR